MGEISGVITFERVSERQWRSLPRLRFLWLKILKGYATEKMISPFVQTTIYSSSADSEIDINLFFSFFSSPKQDLSSPLKVSVPMNSAKFFIFLILIAVFLLGMGYPSRAVLLPPLMDLSNLVFAWWRCSSSAARRGSHNGLLKFPQTLYVCFRFSGSYRLIRSVGWKSYDGQDEATSRATKTPCGRALECQTLSLLSLLVGMVYKRTSQCVRRYDYDCVRAVFVKNSSAQSNLI